MERGMEEECERLEGALREERGDFVTEARQLARYRELAGLSQSECAARLGRSPSAISNRLRLLRLPEDVLEGLRAGALSERHGRALLRLGDAAAQRQALEVMRRDALSVAAAEAWVELLLAARRGAEDGVCQTLRQDTPEAVVLSIRIPKRKNCALQKDSDVV